jgi:hypothetical protein
MNTMRILISSGYNSLAQTKVLGLPPSFTRNEFIPGRSKGVPKDKRRRMIFGILHP